MEYVDSFSCKISCRNAIAVLKADNTALKEELRLENKHSVAPTTSSGNVLVAQLQDESDVLTRKVSNPAMAGTSSNMTNIAAEFS